MPGKYPNENKVFLTGRLTYDPDLRYSASRQVSVCDFTIASERNYQKDGAWKKNILYMQVAVWGKLAEEVSHRLKKGDAVFVEGRLQMRVWNPPSGAAQIKIFEIVCSKIAFLDEILKPTVADESELPETELLGGG